MIHYPRGGGSSWFLRTDGHLERALVSSQNAVDLLQSVMSAGAQGGDTFLLQEPSCGRNDVNSI